MKRIFKFSLIICSIILLSGCSNGEENILKCTMIDTNDTVGYQINGEVTIYSTNNIVDKAIEKEVVVSKLPAIMDYFTTYYKNEYKKAKSKYDGYSHKIILSNDELTSTMTINYHGINMEEFLKDNENLKDYYVSKKGLSIDGIKELYTSKGFTCK